uniref:G-protein coupled receptors family 1 profile domain-containing protein n=1 Tax=Callorhinchus milii TaxID=7868 RepID=A0A4W3HGP3_CALMI
TVQRELTLYWRTVTFIFGPACGKLFRPVGSVSESGIVKRSEMVSCSSCCCVTVNVLAMVVLYRGQCGLSRCVTLYLVAMAGSDLLVLITDIYLHTTFLFYTPVCSFIHVISAAAVDSAVWLTVAFTFDRFVAICYQRLKQKYCTERTASVVIGTLIALLCLENIPLYFTFQHYGKIDNMPWGCIVKAKIRYQPASADHRNDPVSLSFILLWMTSIAHYIQYRVKEPYRPRGLHNPSAIFEAAGFMLQLLSSCTNTAIYAVTLTKFREELKNAIKYPFTINSKYSKKLVPPLATHQV